MIEKRWPWYVSGILLIAAGIAAGIATYLWWLPCRGQMLLGSRLELLGSTLGLLSPSTDFTDACLATTDFAMSTSDVPGVIELKAAGILLAGLAWLIVVCGLAGTRRVRRLALPLGVALPIYAVVTLQWGSSLDILTMVAAALVDVMALLALVAVYFWQPREWAWPLTGLLAVWGAGSPGLVRSFVDWVLMLSWNDSGLDVPPGTGYSLAAAPVIAGVLIIALTVAGARRSQRATLSAATSAQQVEQVDAVA